MNNKDRYEVIIVGAGAAGLFCGASFEKKVNGLILEKGNAGGRKLLMSGNGQCNVTHDGSIKDFIGHYGEKGKQVRTVLYGFHNRAVMDFFEEKGVPMMAREDGKVFPRSMRATDILEALEKKCRTNGFVEKFGHKVTSIKRESEGYRVYCHIDEGRAAEFLCRHLVVASGGCSYPVTGSDGRLFPILEAMGIELVPAKPALTAVFVQEYPYSELSGISFPKVEISVAGRKNRDDLLLTRSNFSGPCILNLSRYVNTGNILSINYFPGKRFEEIFSDLKQNVPKNSKQIATFLVEYLGERMPKRFAEVICRRAGVEGSRKASSLSGTELKGIAKLLTEDKFSVSGTEGFNRAMVTAGGVSLDEVDLKSMEAKRYPELFFSGEALDVDGDTGGYNLQFAWSSAHKVASVIGSRLE